MSADRGRDVSLELTEVRTVLSRAETALSALLNLSYAGNWIAPRWVRDPETGKYVVDGEHPAKGTAPDPDVEAMFAALEEVVARLARWRRTGKTRR